MTVSYEYTTNMKTPLATYLESLDLTVADAAKLSGTPYTTLYQHVRGLRSIRGEQAIHYEQTLDISRSELRPDLWPPQKDFH